MDISRFMKCGGEQPLDNIVSNGGLCAIFRKIACIGDSLSSGEFESFEFDKKGYHDFYEYSWGQFLARDCGSTVYNFSEGGMSAKQYTSFAKKKGFFDAKYLAQAYIIALGVNDVGTVLKGEYELGDISDVDVNDYAKNKPTLIGYYAAIISRYKELQPKARFFLVTPPRNAEPMSEKQLMYDKFTELLHKLCDLFEFCYVIDLRKYAPIYDQSFRDNFYLGGHLNAAGYRLTALMIESYIDYIIRNNPKDFTQVGFIGTGHHNATDKW